MNLRTHPCAFLKKARRSPALRRKKPAAPLPFGEKSPPRRCPLAGKGRSQSAPSGHSAAKNDRGLY